MKRVNDCDKVAVLVALSRVRVVVPPAAPCYAEQQYADSTISLDVHAAIANERMIDHQRRLYHGFDDKGRMRWKKRMEKRAAHNLAIARKRLAENKDFIAAACAAQPLNEKGELS